MTVKPQILYMTIVFYIVIIFSTIMLGTTGIIIIEKKKDDLSNNKDRVEILNAEIKQINDDIKRFQTDREYLISSAKAYGYLEADKEKIVMVLQDENIIADNNSTDTSMSNNQIYKSTNGFLIILLISIFSIVIYIYIKSKIAANKTTTAYRS